MATVFRTTTCRHMARHLCGCLLVLVCGAFPLCAQQGLKHDNIGKQDLKQIQGTWLVTESIRNGVPQQLDSSNKPIEKFSGDRWRGIGKPSDFGTLVLRGSTRPKQIDISVNILVGPSPKGIYPVLKEGILKVQLQGIYKLEKDRLTLALVDETYERPKKFDSPIGRFVWLLRYRRVDTLDEDE